MPKKNKLYQCPYERACKCDLSEPCLGCETWAEHYGKFAEQTTNSAMDAILRAAKGVVAHWDEFGPEHGLDESMEVLRRSLAKQHQ